MALSHLTLPVCSAMLCTLFVCSAAYADPLLVDPARVTASSEIPGFDRGDDYMVDRSGLNGVQHNTTPDGYMWLSSSPAYGGLDPDPSVVFDFGMPVTVDSMRVWNYNESGGSPPFITRGVQDVNITYGLASPTETALPGITSFQSANASSTYTGELFDSFTPFAARFVKFDIDSNWGSPETFYGLSEVQFEGASNLIAGVTIEDVSSELTTNFDRAAAYTADGSGLGINGPGTHSNVPDGPMWLSAGNGCCGDPADPHVAAGDGLLAHITFDLGSAHDLDALQVWNYNESSGNPGLFTKRGANLVEILVSPTENVGDLVSLGDFSFRQAAGVDNLNFVQTIDLTGFSQAGFARLIGFNMKSSHGSDNQFVGLSEVQFFGTLAAQVIPEPSTLLIWSLLVGLGIGAGWRRKRR